MPCLVCSFCYSFIDRFTISSCSRWARRACLAALSSSLRCLIFMTCSALRLVSSIFFQAFFSSNLRSAIRLARSLASSAAFFLFKRVATRAPVTSSSPSSYCSYPYSSCPSCPSAGCCCGASYGTGGWVFAGESSSSCIEK